MSADDAREKKRAEFAQLLAWMRDDMPAQIEYEVLKARLTWHRYQALRQQGFTEAQALELCKN